MAGIFTPTEVAAVATAYALLPLLEALVAITLWPLLTTWLPNLVLGR